VAGEGSTLGGGEGKHLPVPRRYARKAHSTARLALGVQQPHLGVRACDPSALFAARSMPR
jgi:hypothetical protein